jgi:hypothetical protein
MLAYSKKQAQIRRQFCPFRANKQLRRDRRQDKKATYACLFTFYLCLLICIFLSTKGAYYGANYPIHKQAFLLSTFGA